MFVNYELGLYEYMIDKHPPKFGLSYHWPKNSAVTDSLDDYFHVWANRNPQVQSYHLKRSVFEADVLRMNMEMGVHFYKGKVSEIDITPGAEHNEVAVRLVGEFAAADGADEAAAGERLRLRAPYVVDAAGRTQLLGRKFDNVEWDPEIQTGAFWVRVKGVDRDMFLRAAKQYNMTSSPYYSTNHWFGPGYWCWQIPLDKESNTMSIGVVHHKHVIGSAQLNTLDKYLAFLRANQGFLHSVVTSGEIIDSHYWSKLAFQSKQLFSSDGWAVMGDAAAFYDPFYSIGTTMVAFQVETFTHAITSRTRELADARLCDYNQFNLNQQQVFRKVVQHFDHCASASVMSTRIFFDFIGYFGFTLPLYIGKYHLSRKYVQMATPASLVWVDFMEHCYTQLDVIAQSGIDIGMMDYSHANELLFSSYSPSDMAGHFLANAHLEPRRLNVMDNNQHTCGVLMQWYSLVMYRAYGVGGLLSPSALLTLGKLAGAMAASHCLSWWHWYAYLGAGDNKKEEEMRSEVKHFPEQQHIALQNW
eukprot:TRINITY_DN1008_c0_g1_i1.p1 TRINITY_DN1008_c0_g1~~TRINITY_DN1008_c0_g1_i1.p1  ORF type:complete len:607 (-),score=252.82 TRINITY_DN1008_c0_g1_i1:296-1885(-)